MEVFSYLGLFKSLLEIVREIRDKTVGYDEQISDKFDRVIAKALKPYVKDDDQYIKNVMIHTGELTDMIVRVIDDESLLIDIETPNYIAPNEFRSVYYEAKGDKELWRELWTKWNEYKSKDTNNRVKAIQAEIGRLDEKIEKIDKRAEEIKEDTGEMKRSLDDLNENVNNRFDKLNERIDDMDHRKGGGRNDDIQSLCDYLKNKLEEKRKHHPSFRLMDIDENLFPDGMVTFDTEARDSNDDLKTVSEIVAESWERGETNHLMIEGEGGIGKTVTLLKLPDNFAPHPVPAIYIPLHELKEETNTIEKYIKKRVLDSLEQYDLLQEVVKKPWNEGPHLLLLLDGFNEIAIEHRESISEDIEQWSENPGLQIITSSRFDIHQYVALRSSFSKIELQPLSEETVSAFLVSHKMGILENPDLIKLITTPLLLTLYIKAEAIRNDRPSPFAKFKETKNAGLLIWNYLQCELWRFRNKKAESKASVLALEFIAPYIAWTMQQHTEFVLDESSFFDRIDEAYLLLKNHVDAHGQLPDHIKTTLRQSPGLPSSEHIGDLLKEHLCLFINNEGEYRLMHQQFRDALAAMHLINSSYLSGGSLPEEWESTVDHYVMQFVVDLISEEEADRLWEQNRKTTPALEKATINQLRLQGLLHNNDFSHLEFSRLDLSNISLYPYRYGEVTLALPTSPEKMNNIRLSARTFSPEGHQGSVTAVAVTPNGKRIVSGSDDHTIRVWDLETGAAIGDPIEGHKNLVTAVAVTPDGKHIVSGSDDRTILVWNLETGTPIGKPIKGHKDRVTAVAVTSDGKRIVSGSYDKTIRVWDLESGTMIVKPLKGHKGGVAAIAVTPDGKRIVSGSDDRTICVWDLERGVRKPIIGHKSWVCAVAVTPDGKYIVSGSDDRTIRLWDSESGAAIGNPIEGHKNWVRAVVVTPDGKRIVSGSDDHTIRVWDLETGALLGKPIEGHENWVRAVAVTPDGKRIVSGSWDNAIHIWDLETDAPIGTPIKGHKNSVFAVAVTHDGKRIVSGSGDCTIRVWDLESGVPIGKPIAGHKGGVTAVAVTPDGKRIVSGSGDRTIRIWDLESGVPIGKPIVGHKGGVNALAVTPDGKRIVSGSGDTIRVWDLESGVPIGKPIKGHKNWVRAVAVTPDGKRIVSGSDDHTICIWDLESGVLIGKLIEGHKNWVRAVAVTPDGKRVVSGSWDCTIRVWDLKTGAAIGKPIEGHKGGVYAVAVSLDGKRIVSGSRDGTICITDIETHENKTIKVHPLSFVGLDFSLADIPDLELKETLRQNGAKV